MGADMDLLGDLIKGVAIALFLIERFIYLPKYLNSFKKEDEDVSS